MNDLEVLQEVEFCGLNEHAECDVMLAQAAQAAREEHAKQVRFQQAQQALKEKQERASNELLAKGIIASQRHTKNGVVDHKALYLAVHRHFSPPTKGAIVGAFFKGVLQEAWKAFVFLALLSAIISVGHALLYSHSATPVTTDGHAYHAQP